MHRTYKFLLRPTSRQVVLLNECLRDHRMLYNAALEERRAAWRQRVTISYFDQSSQMPDIRAADSDIARWSSKSLEQTLRKLQRAFGGFFRRVKAGQTPGYPRFKGAKSFDSVTWRARDGARWDSGNAGARRVYLQGIGHVRVHDHRDVQGRVRTLSVKREGPRWYLTVSCDEVPADPIPRTGRITGLDLGVKSLLTTSEGEHVGNPEYGRVNGDELAAAQRALARCKKGSERRKSALHRVARLHRKVRRQRIDYFRKIALHLVREHDVIVHEALRIGDMTRSAAGTADQPGTRVTQKAGLNRSILDAGWGVFLSILNAKAESAGRELIAVNPRNTSRTCPKCGHVSADNRVTQDVFRCVQCGHSDHADVNGALNILRAGLALREAAA